MIIEKDVKLDIEMPKGVVSLEMDTFYNPVMTSNRNISIALINAFSKVYNKNNGVKKFRLALPLCGSGIRALRFLKELDNEIVEELSVNDKRENFEDDFLKALKQNNLDTKEQVSKIKIHNKEASEFLLSSLGFDYIDIDPFGSPNPFLAAAVARINRGGILAVTATDTGALAGTYIKAGRRKYFADGLKCYMKHEIGLRILIRKVQLQGVQFGKALIPILSYHKDHYYRVFFVSRSGKKLCDEILKEHKYFLFNSKTLEFKESKENVWIESEKLLIDSKIQVAGPLWCGELHDFKLVSQMCRDNLFEEEYKFLETLNQEASNLNVVGFLDSHELAKSYKIPTIRNEELFSVKDVWRTQFSDHGVKTKMSVKELLAKLGK